MVSVCMAVKNGAACFAGQIDGILCQADPGHVNKAHKSKFLRSRSPGDFTLSTDHDDTWGHKEPATVLHHLCTHEAVVRNLISKRI
jgi:hypothetical protein